MPSTELSGLVPLTQPLNNSLFYVTDPTEPVPFDRSKSITWLDLRKALGAAITTVQDVYVAKNGDDTDGDGSLLAPYLTVGAAVAAVVATGLAAAGAIYVINIGAGRYAENVALPSFIILKGCAGTSDITAIDGTVSFDVANSPAAADSLMYITDLTVDTLSMDGVFAGGHTTYIYLTTVTVLTAMTLSLTGNSATLLATNCSYKDALGYFEITVGALFSIDFFIGRLDVSGTGAVGRVANSQLNDLLASSDATVEVYASDVEDMTTAGTAAITIDVISYPKGTVTLGSATPVSLASESSNLKYTETAGAWLATAPANVKAALDILGLFSHMVAEAGGDITITTKTGETLTLTTKDGNKDIIVNPNGSGKLVVRKDLQVGDTSGSYPGVKVYTAASLTLFLQPDLTENVKLAAGKSIGWTADAGNASAAADVSFGRKAVGVVGVGAGQRIQLGEAAVAETPANTHTLIFRDSTGTAYKVLALLA